MTPYDFSKQELVRYQRHLALDKIGLQGQNKLKCAKVLVIGAGGLSCPALQYLAAAGVGTLTVIDPDLVEESNLQRQILYCTEDLGQSKVETAARRLRAQNPFITIQPIQARFCNQNALELCANADVIIDGCDNLATRYLTNDACVLTNKPFVYGAIHQFEGQVSVFNWQGGPSYRCLFPEEPTGAAIPNCAQAGVLGVLPGIIGTIQASEAIKLITGIGTPLSGRVLFWDALEMQSRCIRLTATPLKAPITALPADGSAACQNSSPDVAEGEISLEAFKQLSLSTQAQLIDIREAHEVLTEGGIEHSIHYPLSHLERGEFPSGISREVPLVLYCAAGIRSLRALELFRRRGFNAVFSLRGGYTAWRTQSGI